MPPSESPISPRRPALNPLEQPGEGRDPFTDPSQTHEKDPRLELVAKIAGSRHFRKSPRLAHFLFYVVQCEVLGRDDEISEQQIGVHVFGRSATYNPGDDNIVRAYARNLRSRLEEYYRGEGKADPLLLQIPRGAYRPVFLDRRAAQIGGKPLTGIQETEDFPQAPVVELPASSGSVYAEPAIPQNIFRAQRVYLAALAVLLLIAICVFSYQAGQGHVVRILTQKDRVFWKMLFNSRQDTLIVPGDSSLVLLEGITRKVVTPDEYERKIYDTDVVSKLGANSALISNLAQRPYTSIVDLQAANRLSSLPEVVPERTYIRFARDLHIEDLKSANVILLGSSLANPWVQLFDARLSLHLTYQTADGGYKIENLHPRPGEKEEYPFDPQDKDHRAYALVAFLPNLSGRGSVLLIEGTSMAGTQAALDFLFNEDSMQHLLARCRMPDGSLGSFEVLLEAMDVGSRAAGSSTLVERTLLPVSAN